MVGRDVPETIGALFRSIGDLAPQHGIARGELDNAESTLGFKIPVPLRQYYEVIGNHEITWAFNRDYAPNEIECRDGMAVFCEENQCVVYWGFKIEEADLDDPSVWQLNPHENKWYFECKRMSSYLVKSLCWQAACGGLTASASGTIMRDQFAKLGSSFDRIECVEVDDDYDLKAFAGDGIILCAFPDAKKCPVYAGSNDAEKLERLADRFGLDML
ncbi:MAG TPA: hypothetical protein VFV87_08715 [Pirellulaceae bacterium]|nr:hypothetical protein [Pirellulaceae bacterium]